MLPSVASASDLSSPLLPPAAPAHMNRDSITQQDASALGGIISYRYGLWAGACLIENRPNYPE